MDDADHLAAMMAKMAAMMSGSSSFGDVVDSHRASLRPFAKLSPIQAASAFGAMLTIPALQGNVTRLEWLTHLALALGDGAEPPSAKFVRDAFAELGKGVAGRIEDPTEDVMVGLVRTSRGDFRIVEGTWEAASFYLERIVDVVDTLPDGPGFNELRESVYGLLRLSDQTCARAGLIRYHMGAEYPARAAPVRTRSELNDLVARLRFTPGDLDALQIDLQNLDRFIFDPAERGGLLAQVHGHSALERYPLALDDSGDVVLLLPTAVSLAIRRMVITELQDIGLGEALLGSLALAYADHFATTPILGRTGRSDVEFRRTQDGLLSGLASEVDPGRFLQMVFFVDTLEGFETDTFAGSNPDPIALADDLDAWIDHVAKPAMAQPTYRSGLTLLIGCGVGRGVAHAINRQDRPGWTIETISAPDFSTLCWIPHFDDRSLLRLITAQEELAALGTRLKNVNGLLNLVAWQRALDGHLVPHGHLPDDASASQAERRIMITQNGLREVRQTVATAWDAHMQRTVDGTWTRVRKEARSFFKEDQVKPFYVSEAEPAGVFVTERRAWWCVCETPKDAGPQAKYERWKAMGVWLSRAAPVLEQALRNLPVGALLWRCVFAGSLDDVDPDAPEVGFEAARAALSVRADAEAQVICVDASAAYEQASLQIENVAERALVDALVCGAAALAGETLTPETTAKLVEQIVPNPMARQQHAFRAPEFRDYVPDALPKKPCLIGRDDDAQVRLGLGWRVRQETKAAWITGKAECGAFLNGVVRELEEEVCAELRRFDRLAMLRLILLNHEAAAVDRANWRRTVGAILALHDDKAAALETMAERETKLNSVFQACRVLVEFALCECPLEGGAAPGRMDLTRLMAKVMQIFSNGGFSDAIRWEVMEPRLKVTALGDIHANWDLVDEFLRPYGRATSQDRAESAVGEYGQNVDHPKIASSVHDQFDEAFLRAFEDEVGASLDDMRLLVDLLEQRGVAAGKAVLSITRQALLREMVAVGKLEGARAERLVDYLTLKTRSSWSLTPEGYDDRDLQPWRFRRRLAILRKPLLQIDEAENARILLAPGIVREAFVYTVSNLRRGDFPDWQLKRPMRRWQGQVADRRGGAFARDVAATLEAGGWRVQVEVKISKILDESLDQDFGDVDVLAWRPDGSRVLLIECKDVQYRKTLGEIAEQLADFRGGHRANGKRDYLRLHLDRVAVLRGRADDVARYLGLSSMASLESHLVFRNPVPMKYALTRLAEQVTVTLFSELGDM
jgi:hypothetical protein